MLYKLFIETNIRQRGDIGGSAKKVVLRIKELERIYGIREGSAGNSELNNSTGDTPKTESELAEQLGVSRYTLQNYKQLANMIPELSELVDTGIALSIIEILLHLNSGLVLVIHTVKKNSSLTTALPSHQRILQIEVRESYQQIRHNFDISTFR